MSKQLTAQAPVDPIVLGKMGSSYGIRGWLRVFSSTEDAESIFDYQPWFIQKAGQWQQVQLESWKHHNQDMMGCQVVTTEGYDLGKVVDMMETGSNDVLVIKANLKDAFGIKERLVPFLDGQVIKKVDLTTRSIEVDWDPGF